MKKIAPAKKPPGRPAMPEGLRREARLSVRTFPDVAMHAKLIGTAGLEALIRGAKIPGSRVSKAK